ncbi:hypothetical protein Clacol_000410 [Clathrus columnatus]|uniref:Pre-mRNA-splicing factor CWC24 n=1 Tax=Clathrus columnatus TaxID=1419009 RepID=A0AAV5A2W0_9AGAM|nr:hypothetical protein Clacol_000410 [Clathrus columnatus]
MTDNVKVSFFKKGKTRPTTARQRSPGLSSELPVSNRVVAADATSSEVVIPTRKAPLRLLSQGTKRTRTEEEEEEEEVSGRPDVNWAAGSSSNVNAVLDILEGDEAEALLERKRRRFDDDAVEDVAPDDGLYRGQSAYKSHITKSKEVPKAMRVGPQKSTSTIRTVTIIDYQPDVCKDYKETGFCGFGDTCKFLHDRGTYLAGWQLDKLAADPKNDADEAESNSDSDEDIPFACLICRKPYTDPVVTRCGHYFCSSCAIKRFAKTPKCLACNAPTGGIFNRADKVISKVNAKRKKHAPEDEAEPSNIEVEGLADDSDQSDDD